MTENKQAFNIRLGRPMIWAQFAMAAVLSGIAIVAISRKNDLFLGALFGLVAFENLALAILGSRRYVKAENSKLVYQGYLQNKIFDLTTLTDIGAITVRGTTIILKNAANQKLNLPLSYSERDNQKIVDYLKPFAHRKNVRRDKYIEKLFDRYDSSKPAKA